MRTGERGGERNGLHQGLSHITTASLSQTWQSFLVRLLVDSPLSGAVSKGREPKVGHIKNRRGLLTFSATEGHMGPPARGD